VSLIGFIGDSIRAAGDYYKPDDGIDLLGLAIIALPPTITAAAAFAAVVIGQRKASTHRLKEKKATEEIGKNVAVVRQEVKNSHEENLRDDLDKKFAGLERMVREGFKSVGRDIGGIREELRTERIERIEGDKRRD
jgi:Protein of unknown function (DUF2746)